MLSIAFLCKQVHDSAQILNASTCLTFLYSGMMYVTVTIFDKNKIVLVLANSADLDEIHIMLDLY